MVTQANGYAFLDRRWKKGDVVALNLPLDLRLEPAPDRRRGGGVRGPLVMAADLGPVESAGPVSTRDGRRDAAGGLRADGFGPSALPDQRDHAAGNLVFVPFYSQYDRRSAVYFKRFSEAAGRARRPPSWPSRRGRRTSRRVRSM
jgi:DUF1680 family protein